MKRIIVQDDEVNAIIGDMSVPVECDSPACKKKTVLRGKQLVNGYKYKCKHCGHECTLDLVVNEG